MNHYKQLGIFTAKALAIGVDSQETENLIREECVNQYVEKQKEKSKIETLKALKKICDTRNSIVGLNILNQYCRENGITSEDI